MALEMMEQVRAAEAQAENLRRQAQLEAREIVKAAEEACRAIERESVQEIKERTAELL